MYLYESISKLIKSISNKIEYFNIKNIKIEKQTLYLSKYQIIITSIPIPVINDHKQSYLSIQQ